MATKKQLYEALQKLQEENYTLRAQTEAFRMTLLSHYMQARSVLGIEAAAQAREDAKKAKKKGKPA